MNQLQQKGTSSGILFFRRIHQSRATLPVQ